MAGQVIYHLLAAANATRAPWTVVVLVSCVPVITLGFGAALTHLLRAPASAPVVHLNGHGAPEGGTEAARRYAAGLTAGEVPSVRRIRREMHVGQPRAQEVRAYLAALTRT